MRRSLAAALLAAAVGLATAGPALASEPSTPPPPPPPPSSTTATRAPEPVRVAPTPPPSTAAPGSTTTVRRSGGVEVGQFLSELAGKVSRTVTDPAVRNALLSRIAAARATFAAGGVVDNATMQALLRDVYAALGTPPGKDAKPEPPRPSTTAPTTAPDDHGGEHGAAQAARKAGVLTMLEAAAAKVTASSLDDATKSALLDRLAAVRAAVEAGKPLGTEELGQLLKAVREALETRAGAPAPSSAEAGDARGRAAAALQRQIAKVQGSELPDDVKAQVVAALQAALAKLSGGEAPGSATSVRELLEQQRAAKLEALRAKLEAAREKLTAAADAAAAAGVDPATVDAARDALTRAGEALELATSPDDLRAVWALLRDARLALTGETPAP